MSEETRPLNFEDYPVEIMVEYVTACLVQAAKQEPVEMYRIQTNAAKLLFGEDFGIHYGGEIAKLADPRYRDVHLQGLRRIIESKSAEEQARIKAQMAADRNARLDYRNQPTSTRIKRPRQP